MTRDSLPIDAILPDLVAVLRDQPSAVLRAPTGAGKTTRVPPALLDADILTGTIVMLEPRRIAARAAARRMSQERGTVLGDCIGYHVRFERQASRHTRILAVTPGILLRMLHDDPYLESVGAILFDEFHERSLDSDLALGLVRLLQQTVRPDLRLVVMSATIEGGEVAAYLGGCPVIASAGRLFPVATRYEPRSRDDSLPESVARAVEMLLDETPGDVLALLPGWQEIRGSLRLLENVAQRRDLLVLPLHGDLPAEQQDAALMPQSKRKVVLATNVAETSVTVEGVTGVVDSGLVRMLRLDRSVGLDRLEVEPISRASADQRAGRAGRTAPGVCIRLWSEASHRTRPEQTEPEIGRVDLAGAILHLMSLGESDVLGFPWLEAPPALAVNRALELLRLLGALDDSGVTGLGRAMARLPVHPRLARLLLEGRKHGAEDAAALTAALLAERDPFARPLDHSGPRRPRHATASDILDRLAVLEEFERTRNEETPIGTLERNAARFVLRARDQLVRAVRSEANRERQPLPTAPDEAVMRALLAAYPDRLAKRREPGSPRGVMVGGRGVRLTPASAVTEAELFLCIDVDAGGTESLVRLASAVRRDWLAEDKLTSKVDVSFDADTEKVVARKVLRFADLILEETPAALPAEEEVSRVLAAAASERLPQVLPPEDAEARQFLTRVRWLRQWMPELKLPAFDEAELREVLTWVCQRRRSFAQVREGWLEQLQGRLTRSQMQAVEREAPERLEVPSGNQLALKYEEDRPPVLAVRIQEMFGWTDTPRIAGGRVKVLLHLLAPNFRPQQVTDDLASFWVNTYPQVRKELRARYPKHAWPEQPLG